MTIFICSIIVFYSIYNKRIKTLRYVTNQSSYISLWIYNYLENFYNENYRNPNSIQELMNYDEEEIFNTDLIDINQIKIIENFNDSLIVVYWIGTDGIDDFCTKLFKDDRSVMNLFYAKGDVVLGQKYQKDNCDVKFIKPVFFYGNKIVNRNKQQAILENNITNFKKRLFLKGVLPEMSDFKKKIFICAINKGNGEIDVKMRNCFAFKNEFKEILIKDSIAEIINNININDFDSLYFQFSFYESLIQDPN